MTPRKEDNNDLIIPLHTREGMEPRTVRIQADEFQWQFARSGGPGGQNVNKVSSKAILRWNPHRSALPADVLYRFLKLAKTYLTSEGELLLTSQRHRTQLMNIDDCLQKLRQLVLAAVPPPVFRRPTRPTKGSKERRLHAKKQQSSRRANRRISDHD